ncbi:MAG: hydrogenase maturation protease [Nitrososphaeria archaeon]|nr:hydrogenase maturation protease [Nitrososphaeria archaeon]
MAEELLSKFRELLRTPLKKVFVCVGNELRGDDEVGIYIGRRLKRTSLKDNVILAYNTPENHIHEILEKDADIVVFFDAVHVGVPAGTIIFQEISPEKPLKVSISTHSIPVETIASIIQSLSNKKVSFYIIGVEAKKFDFGNRISEEVVCAAKTLTKILKETVEEFS